MNRILIKPAGALNHSIVENAALSLLSPKDLISKLMDSASDSWMENENCYNFVSVPETYTGPRLSFPLSLPDMNALLSAFKERQVQSLALLKLKSLVFVFGTVLFFFRQRRYTPGMFCSCCTRPESSSNRCPTLSTCPQHTPRRSLYVVGDCSSLNSNVYYTSLSICILLHKNKTGSSPFFYFFFLLK